MKSGTPLKTPSIVSYGFFKVRVPVSFFSPGEELVGQRSEKVVGDVLAGHPGVGFDELAGGFALHYHPVDEIVDADIGSREHGHLAGVAGFRVVGAAI